MNPGQITAGGGAGGGGRSLAKMPEHARFSSLSTIHLNIFTILLLLLGVYMRRRFILHSATMRSGVPAGKIRAFPRWDLDFLFLCRVLKVNGWMWKVLPNYICEFFLILNVKYSE